MKYLVIFSIFLSACGFAKDKDDGVVQSAGINRVWSATTPWWSVDLKNISTTGVFIVTWYGARGEVCQSAANATGDLKTGTMTTVLSTLVTIWPNEVPGCGRWDADWTYAFSGGSLTLCPTNPVDPCVHFN